MKRILSVLLMTVLLLSMLTGVASASRASDAIQYMIDYIMEHGEHRTDFVDRYFYVFQDVVVDRECHPSGNYITFYSQTDELLLYASAYWPSVFINLSKPGYITEFLASDIGFEEQISIDPALIRPDTTFEITDFYGSAEEQELSEQYVSAAFHRALTNINSILKTGGYSLADLGFTNYTPYLNPCCYYIDQCPGKKFTDMPAGATWSHDAIDWAVKENITTGTSATTFQPNMDCSRGQIVTFLWRAAGSPKAAQTAHPFKDVTPGAYYYDAMLWAVEQGITSGTSANTFSPDRVCSRSEVVTFLWRANGKPAAEYDDNRFQDVEEGSFYVDAVKWAISMNITQGTSNTTFAPALGCSRAQVVTFLYRNDLFS